MTDTDSPTIEYHPDAPRPSFMWTAQLPLNWRLVDTQPSRWRVCVDRLRMGLLDRAMGYYGEGEPPMTPRSPKILSGSDALGAPGLVGTIGASSLIQFFMR